MNFNYNDYYNFDKIKNFISSIITPEDLDSYKNLQNYCNSESFNHENFRYVIAAMIEEDISFSAGVELLVTPDTTKIAAVKELVDQYYGNVSLPHKKTSLLNLYNLDVYWGDSNSNASYASEENIESEVKRIYNEYKDNFKSDLINNLLANNNVAQMFLTINNKKAKILDEYLGIFSSLLNYNMKKGSARVKKLAALSGVTESNINDLIDDKEIFFQFLEALSRRTIHYTYGG